MPRRRPEPVPLSPRRLIALFGIGAFWAAGRALLRPADGALTRTTIPLASLPPGLSGLTILLLSDLHVRAPRGRPLAALDGLAGLQPDLLAIAGDVIEDASLLPAVIRRLRAIRPRYGSFAVWGNHDMIHYRGDAGLPWLGTAAHPLAAMRRSWNEAGIALLDNASTALNVGSDRLQIVGLGDATRHAHDAETGFAGADASLFTLVLTHNPDAAYALDAHRADLVLCGHTHGGQIVPPFMRPPHTSTRRRLPRACGLMHICGRPVVITRGLGTVGLPFRLNAPAEASLLCLIRPDA